MRQDNDTCQPDKSTFWRDPHLYQIVSLSTLLLYGPLFLHFDVSLRKIVVTLSTAQLTQYAATSYQRVLDEYGLIPSMSRNGNCWDTACVDSFFGTLKREPVDHRRDVAREEARQDTFEYIEVF